MKKLTLSALLLTSLFAGTTFASQFDKPGFVTEVEDGRLWVFREGSQELKDLKEHGEPAKQFTDVGTGPEGMTVKAADEKTLKDYLTLCHQISASYPVGARTLENTPAPHAPPACASAGGFTCACVRTYSLNMNTPAMTRTHAIEAAIESLDSAFFKALCEPSRVAVLKRVMQLGRADVSEIAADLPQERSVVSRHLQVLLEANIVRATKAGRQVFYEVDGPAIVTRLESILQHTRSIAALCCPGGA
ncbi:DNA-binding transcriptional repressor ArsR [compost metagenome]